MEENISTRGGRVFPVERREKAFKGGGRKKQHRLTCDKDRTHSSTWVEGLEGKGKKNPKTTVGAKKKKGRGGGTSIRGKGRKVIYPCKARGRSKR